MGLMLFFVPKRLVGLGKGRVGLGY